MVRRRLSGRARRFGPILARRPQPAAGDEGGHDVLADEAALLGVRQDAPSEQRALRDLYELVDKMKHDSWRLISETMNPSGCCDIVPSEAPICRDWQDAIADAMLERDPVSVRGTLAIKYLKE